MKWLSLLLACFLAPTLASAQEGTIQNITPEVLETFIKEVMRTKTAKTEFPNENRVAFTTPDGYFDVVFRGGARKSILFRYPFAKLKAPLEALNDWNHARRHPGTRLRQ